MTRSGSIRGHRNDSSKKCIKVPTDLCLNCGQQLVVSNDQSKATIGTGIVAFTSVVRNVKTQVFIRDAVKEIYSILYTQKFEKDLDNSALCVDCCLLFAQLYGLLQAFESRRKTDGFLGTVLTRGIRGASELKKNDLTEETEEGIRNDFDVEFQNFFKGASYDRKSVEVDDQVHQDHSTAADLITVESVQSSEQQIEENQWDDCGGDGILNFDFDDEEPPSIPACDDSDENDEEVSRTIENPVSRASDNSKPGNPDKIDTSSAGNFRAPVRKSRRIEKQEKPKRQTVEKDSEDGPEASDYSPAASENPDDSSSSRSNSDSECGTNDNKAPGRKRKRSRIRREVTYKCTDCSEEFSHTLELANHRKHSHDSKELFKCHICLTTFTAGVSLKTHLLKQFCRTSDSEKMFKCFECGERFRRVGELGNHRRDIHGTENNLYVCHICLYSCKYSHLLKPHIAGHIGARNFKCSKCGKAFRRRNNLKCHLWNVHKVLLLSNLNNASASSRDILFSCRKCRMEFEDREKYIEHSKTEHGGTLVSCDHCDAVFFDKIHLKSHLLKHEDPKLKCRHCEKMLFNSSERYLHEKYSHNDRTAASSKVDTDTRSTALPASGQFPCSQCSLAFDTEVELSVHVDCLHKDVGSIKCDLCEKTYINRENLNHHKRGFHGLLKCRYCRQEVERDAMTAHVADSHPEKLLTKKPKGPSVKPAKKSEDDEIDYHCSDCNEILEDIPSFRIHRKMHGIAPEEIFKCYICLRKLSKREKFRHHMRSHNERTDWPCPHCRLRFPVRTSRNEHQAQVHGPQADDDPNGMLPLPPAQTLQLISGETDDLDDKKKKKNKGVDRSNKIEPFKCTECDLEFKRSLQLGNHRALVHGCPVEKRYQCHRCLKFCPSAAALHAHAMVHNDDTPHLCEACGKAFKTKDYLLQHYRLMHTEDERKALKDRWKNFRVKKAAENKAESVQD